MVIQGDVVLTRLKGVRRLVAGVLAMSALITGPARSAAPEEIGTVVAAKQVTGIVEADERKLAKGDPLYQDEVLVTGTKGSGEFRLKDDSRLALGPGARLTLDEFVYDPARSTPTLVLSLVKGAFRFLTGKLDHNAYTIKAGVSSLAVRGTVFDVFVDETAGVAVLLHEGVVDVCGAGNICQKHDAVGRVVHVTRAGVPSPPLEWSDTIMPGVSLKRAFPFLSRRLAIDPVRRLGSVAIIENPVAKSSSKTVRKAGSTVRKTTRRVRRLLPSPF
jgi:hypothetical protein